MKIKKFFIFIFLNIFLNQKNNISEEDLAEILENIKEVKNKNPNQKNYQFSTKKNHINYIESNIFDSEDFQEFFEEIYYDSKDFYKKYTAVFNSIIFYLFIIYLIKKNINFYRKKIKKINENLAFKILKSPYLNIYEKKIIKSEKILNKFLDLENEIKSFNFSFIKKFYFIFFNKEEKETVNIIRNSKKNILDKIKNLIIKLINN